MIGRALTVTLLASILILSAAAVRAAGENSRTADVGASTATTYAVPRPSDSRVPVREHCPHANRLIGRYRRAYTAARERMGLAGAVPRVWYPCDATRRRASEWRTRARAAADQLAVWRHYQYAWWDWMPRGWQSLGACETGYGHRPGNFRHNSGTYQGSFGFYHGSWDAFVGSADPKAGPYPSEAYEATPRQQYEVALAIYRRFGLSGWGCRGAFYR